jgi:hypothetical protein
MIRGLTPLATRNFDGGAFALFAIDQEGVQLLEVAGANAGAYQLRLFVGGDVDGNGTVDGLDSGQVIAALGSKPGDADFIAHADTNRDGVIDEGDLQILASNFGFQANRPPVISATTLMTHIDLELTVDLSELVHDPEEDAIYVRVSAATNGTATLGGDGRMVHFTPALGYSGQASFTLAADDDLTSSAPVEFTVPVSNAPLLHLDFSQRPLQLHPGQRIQVAAVGDFARGPERCSAPRDVPHVNQQRSGHCGGFAPRSCVRNC